MILTANAAVIVGDTAVMYLLPHLQIGNYALAIALDALLLMVIVTTVMHLTLSRSEYDLEMAHRGLSLKAAEMKDRAKDTALLEEMGELMLTTRTPRETYEIVARYISRLFPGTSGGLYLLRHSRNALEQAGSWGERHGSEPWFAPEDCWAFRRGKRHLVDNSEESLPCAHAGVKGERRSCCVPLFATGEFLGLLHLEADGGPPAGGPRAPAEFKLELLNLLASRVALALAINRLQQKLESQAIRDPLTGLLNRRYLEESFQRELHRARRKQESVGVIMMDLDHFKQINDEYGHDAGDAVLRAVAATVQKHVREEDIASRLGGEEFLLVLPGMTLEHLQRRAGELLARLAELRVTHNGRTLRAVTASLGLACYPTHGEEQNRLLRVADEALYASKNAGRNRASVAREAAPPEEAAPAAA